MACRRRTRSISVKTPGTSGRLESGLKFRGGEGVIRRGSAQGGVTLDETAR